MTSQRYSAFFEPLEEGEGFAVQVPDLAIATHGATLDAARGAAHLAIAANLEAYQEAGKIVPPPEPARIHLENPEFHDSLFAYVEPGSLAGR